MAFRLRKTEYSILPMHHKVLLLESDGCLLSYFMNDEESTALYFYNNFYVELIFDVQTNDLVQIIEFNETSRLSKYLEAIRLGDLVGNNRRK